MRFEAVHLRAVFCGGGALARGVGFVDYGAVEEVAAQGEQEVRAGVGAGAERGSREGKAWVVRVAVRRKGLGWGTKRCVS